MNLGILNTIAICPGGKVTKVTLVARMGSIFCQLNVLVIDSVFLVRFYSNMAYWIHLFSAEDKEE